MPTAIISHPDCLLHDMGEYHPESPHRVNAINNELDAANIEDYILHYEAPLAEYAQLARVHTSDHIKRIQETSPQSGLAHIDPDTAMNPYSLAAALRAAGAGVLATDLVIEGKVKNAFCNIRPPGHHAERRRAMGFCFFNNIAVAAAHALEHHDLERVAIVDFDVHHGNGTEDIFSDDTRVLMVSIFQHPFYPHSGINRRSEYMVNIPLSAHADGSALRAVVKHNWLPALHDFQPQMIFISAGFDAHQDDNMAMLNFVEEDYAWVTEQIVDIADKYANGRIVSMLEGGYQLEALAHSAVAHVSVLAKSTSI